MFSGYADYQAVVANLVLHHLSGAELSQLGRKLNRGPRFICACEARPQSIELAIVLGLRSGSRRQFGHKTRRASQYRRGFPGP